MSELSRPTAVAASGWGAAAVAVSVATACSLVILGVVLGGVGLLVVPMRPRIVGVSVPVAWFVAVVNFVAARLAQSAFHRWWAPVLPLGGWALVVGSAWAFTPGGDSLVAYDDASLIFVLLGVLAFAATVGTAATPPPPTGR